MAVDVTVGMVEVAAHTVVEADMVEAVTEEVDMVVDEEVVVTEEEAEDMAAVATESSMLNFHNF